MSGRPVQPRYIGNPGSDAPKNVLSAFWQDQVVNPEYRAGNLKCVSSLSHPRFYIPSVTKLIVTSTSRHSILLGVTTFAVGVFAVRNFGGLLVPGF
jgi:hypothetical protein